MSSFAAYIFSCCPSLLAATQEEVFRSIEQSVSGEPVDSAKMLGVILFVAATAIVVLVIAQRRAAKNDPTGPKVLNHNGKLLKEISRGIDLSALEMRQLRQLTDQLRTASAPAPTNPLTLLLCPSLLKRGQSKK